MAKVSSDLVKERLRLYLADAGLNNRSFEVKCGLYNGFVKDMDSKITFESLSKIGSACPNLNLGWLFSGVGQMVYGDTTSNVQVSTTSGPLIQNVFVTNFADLKGVMVEAIKESRQ